MDKTFLLSGFDPFGGEQINPAYEVVRRLPEMMDFADVHARIHTVEVPTVFGKSVECVCKEIDRLEPDYIICIGQAGGRFGITPERVAINIDDACIADNEGNQPLGQVIEKNGEAAYFSTLPINAICRRIRSQGIPSSISNTAGTFVCNHLMYGVLHHIVLSGKTMKAGFIHIPFLLEQVLNKSDTAGFSLQTLQLGIVASIEACMENIVLAKL